MDRRCFLKAAATGAAALTASTSRRLAAPALAQDATKRVLRFIPQGPLAELDPIASADYVVRNAAALVFDTLYGLDRDLKPRRQMVEAEEISADGRIWTFRLRPELLFHSGEPVLARDAVASINRWAARDATGAIVKSIENELAVVDDRTFRWTLRTPFRKLLLALGKMSPPCCFIMPAELAATDPFEELDEYVGSGPMRFIKSEWAPGERAAFDKFRNYEPRDETASWLAGGKRMFVDCVEWLTLADPAAAAAAVRSGTADWWEIAPPERVPELRADRNITVAIADPLGAVGLLVFNHLAPPFRDVRARRAFLMALSQPDYMAAYPANGLWRPLPGFFTPGTPFYNEEGGDVLSKPRRGNAIDAARDLLHESGYSGAPVTGLIAQDIPASKAWGGVTADLLTRLGMNVNYVATNRADLAARRAGGDWHVYPEVRAGADCADPTNTALRADGSFTANGWPDIAPLEEGIAEWFFPDAGDDERVIARALNKAALDEVVAAPLGFFLSHRAWRNAVSGTVPGPLPFFWDVSKQP
jgi:peptide/nickel transport system substrate-binding protein